MGDFTDSVYNITYVFTKADVTTKFRQVEFLASSRLLRVVNRMCHTFDRSFHNTSKIQLAAYGITRYCSIVLSTILPNTTMYERMFESSEIVLLSL